jgi:hypothetical protein
LFRECHLTRGKQSGKRKGHPASRRLPTEPATENEIDEHVCSEAGCREHDGPGLQIEPAQLWR